MQTPDKLRVAELAVMINDKYVSNEELDEFRLKTWELTEACSIVKLGRMDRQLANINRELNGI